MEHKAGMLPFDHVVKRLKPFATLAPFDVGHPGPCRPTGPVVANWDLFHGIKRRLPGTPEKSRIILRRHARPSGTLFAKLWHRHIEINEPAVPPIDQWARRNLVETSKIEFVTTNLS
jgi:hypothetical protein